MSRRLRALTLAALTVFIILGLASAPAVRAGDTARWWTLETEHFYIHFRSGLEDLARETAVRAEGIRDILETEFGQAPSKIDIVLDDRHDATNGVTDPLFDRITLYIPNIRWSDVGNVRHESWLSALLFHELVHEVDLNQVRGVPRLLRQVFGKIALPNAVRPMSFIEGVAVYEKFKHLGESRANDSRTQMMARQMAMDDCLPRLDQIEQFYKRDSWPPAGDLVYNYSSLFMKYMEEAYGSEALAEISAVHSRSVPLVGGGFDRAVRRALGASLTDLYDEFIYALRDESTAKIESICAEGVTQSKRLTSLGGRVESPSWVASPDGLGPRLGYAAQSSKRSGIRVFDPATGADQEVFALTAGAAGSFPDWSPRGGSVVYVKPELRSGPYLRLDLYRRDLSTGAETRLTHGERAYYARYSPDGKTVYFACIEQPDGATALCALDLATGTRRRVRSFADCNGSIHSFSVSPDGSRIALALWRGGRQDIYLLSSDGAQLLQLTADTAQDCDPTWTPDGRYVLFSSDPDRVYNIYAADAASGEVRKVTNVISGAFFPAVSPDGRTLAFVGYTSEGYDLFSTMLDLASARPAVRIDPDPALPPRNDDQAAGPAEPSASTSSIPPAAPSTGASTTAASRPHPYNPLRHLRPTMWLPDVSLESAGIAIMGSEPVANTVYTASVGWNFKASSPTYRLALEPSTEWRFPVAAAVAGGRDWSTQNVTLAIPIWGTLPQRGALSLGYEHTSRAGQSQHSLAASGSVGTVWARDLLRSRFTIQADGVVNIGPGMHWGGSAGDLEHEGEPEPTLSITASSATRLPIMPDNLLNLSVSAGWSGSPDPARRLEAGGTQGKFHVRGVDDGYMRASHILAASAEYSIQLAAIEQKIGRSSVFIDDLQASVFVDAATAGDRFAPDNAVVSAGAEMGVSIVQLLGSRNLISIGLAGPVLRRGRAPEPASKFKIYLKLTGAPL